MVISPQLRLLLPILLGIAPAWAVIPVSADGLIAPAHYFDLEGKTVRFTPSGGGYRVSTSKAHALGDCGTELKHPDFPSRRSFGWRIPLPFELPFGGEVRHELFVNSAGNLTFGRPEARVYADRDTWAGGTMQSVAGSLTDRAAAGQEQMIAVLWGLYSPDPARSRIFLRRSAVEFVVTWQVERYIWFGEGYTPLGLNVFQARLTPDGIIDFTYDKVAEKDGIVGLFYGAPQTPAFATLTPPSVEAPDPRLQIGSVTASLAGSTLRFSFQMKSPVVTEVPQGTLWYRVFVDQGSHGCEIGFSVSRTAHPYLLKECTGVPGFTIDRNRLELYVSARELAPAPAAAMRWNADILWARAANDTIRYAAGSDDFRIPSLAVRPFRFTTANSYRGGSVFEVFHYPAINKSVLPSLRYIYQRFPPHDDMAVVLTDFRIDDLHNHQGSTGGGYNQPIQGIGPGPARSYGDGKLMGSAKLQVATGPIYLGPRFAEFLEDGEYHYRNYANAVGWMAHELSHRWGMDLSFRNPRTGRVEALGTGHWSDFLNTPSTVSVWRMFSDKPYTEKSQMEGAVYEEMPRGLFRRLPNPWNLPTGFSALDLYAMGLIGPEEVPDTFLISRPQLAGTFVYSGVKVPVRIQDVIAANGERNPPVKDAQKEFMIGIYLLHQGRAANADKLRQAEGIEKMLIEYFHVATGGRMTLISARPKGARS